MDTASEKYRRGQEMEIKKQEFIAQVKAQHKLKQQMQQQQKQNELQKLENEKLGTISEFNLEEKEEEDLEKLD